MRELRDPDVFNETIRKAIKDAYIEGHLSAYQKPDRKALECAIECYDESKAKEWRYSTPCKPL